MFSLSELELPCGALCSKISSSRYQPLVGFGGRDASLHVYPFMGGTRTAWLQGLTDPVTALAFDPDQSFVVGGSDTGKLHMWDIRSEEVMRSFTGGHATTVTAIDVFRNGNFFSTVSTDKVFRIWDARKPASRQSYKDATAPLCAVQISPNGKQVATGCSRGVVRIYDLVAGKLVHKLELHSGSITSLHFHPDHYFLAVGGGDGSFSVWDMDSLELRFHSSRQHVPVDAVRFCGTRLLATLNRSLRLYNTAALNERTAISLDAPWMATGDVAYSAATEEAWFVEAMGTTVKKYILPLSTVQRSGDAPPATLQSTSESASLSQPTATVVLPSSNSTLSHSPKTPASPIHRTVLKDATTKAEESNSVSTTPTPPESEVPASRATLMLTTPLWGGEGPSFPSLPAAAGDVGASELQMLEQLSREHGVVSATLYQRLSVLRTVRELWSENQSKAIDHVRQLCDSGREFGPLFDLLSALQHHRLLEKVRVESMAGLVELISTALHTGYEPLLMLALRTLRSIAIKFRAQMEEAQRRARSSQSIGYNDPLGMNQHQLVTQKLRDCSTFVFSLADRQDNVGGEARAVLPDMVPPS